MGSALSFKMDSPAKTVPGGAAEGSEAGAPASGLSADDPEGAEVTPVALIANVRERRTSGREDDATALLPALSALCAAECMLFVR